MPGTSTTSARGGGRNTVRFAAASNAVSPDKAMLGLRKRIPEILLTTVTLLHSAILEFAEMPIKPPIVTEMDLIRGRQIVRSLMPLKRLSCDDAQIVARAIAESFAEGRKQGFDIAKDNLQAYPWCPKEAAAKGMPPIPELKEVLRFLSGDHGQPNPE